MSVTGILNAAADLLEAEGRWIQRRLAAPSPMSRVINMSPHDPRATCFCAVGALCKVSGCDNWISLPNHYVLEVAILDAANAIDEFETIAEWNDAAGRTQAEVVQALRYAAKAAS